MTCPCGWALGLMAHAGDEGSTLNPACRDTSHKGCLCRPHECLALLIGVLPEAEGGSGSAGAGRHGRARRLAVLG